MKFLSFLDRVAVSLSDLLQYKFLKEQYLLGVDWVESDVSGTINMKKMFFIVMMLVVAVCSGSAQYITRMDPYEDVIYFSNGAEMQYSVLQAHMAQMGLRVGHLRNGETLQAGIARLQRKAVRDEIERRGLNTVCGGGYYGAGYAMPIFGGSGSSFSIGNGHWGVSMGSSNYGGYQTSGAGLHIGSFHVGTSSAGYRTADTNRVSSRVATRATRSSVKNTTAIKSSSRTTKKVDTISVNDFLNGF